MVLMFPSEWMNRLTQLNNLIGEYRITNKLRDTLQEFKDVDFIEDIDPGQTTWISPMVVVPKPSGDLRVCIDMRLANTAIVQDNYPIPT